MFRRLSSRWRRRVGRETRLDLALGLAVVLAISSPAILTQEPFMSDYVNGLWMAWVQGHAVADGEAPSFFIHTTKFGIFYPMFAFYGGTLWALIGVFAFLSPGGAVTAWIGISMLAVAMAFGGTLWLARLCGLNGMLARIPALVVPTSAYFVTNLYGRGDIPEFVATAAIPLVVAGAVHLLRAPRWRALPVLVFLVAVVMFTGSHNLTLLWGSIVGAGVLLALIVASPTLSVPWRRLASLVGLAGLGVAINAWFLLPDVIYASRTAIGSVSPEPPTIAAVFDSLSLLLNPLRDVPATSTTPALYVQLPVWFLAWACAAAAVAWRIPELRKLRRTWISLAVLTAGLIALIDATGVWPHLPSLLSYIQFPYRLVTYVTLLIAGLVIVGCLFTSRVDGAAARALRGGLVAVAAISVGICLWQLWVPRTEPRRPPEYYATRQQALVSINEPPALSWYEGGAYVDRSLPVVAVSPERYLEFPPASIRDDRFSGKVDAPPGSEPIRTNIAGGPYLVQIAGLSWIGRDINGFAVVQRDASESGPVQVTIRPAASRVVVFGRFVSVVALVVTAALLVFLVVAGRRSKTAPNAQDVQLARMRPGKFG